MTTKYNENYARQRLAALQKQQAASSAITVIVTLLMAALLFAGLANLGYQGAKKKPEWGIQFIKWCKNTEFRIPILYHSGVKYPLKPLKNLLEINMKTYLLGVFAGLFIIRFLSRGSRRRLREELYLVSENIKNNNWGAFPNPYDQFAGLSAEELIKRGMIEVEIVFKNSKGQVVNSGLVGDLRESYLRGTPLRVPINETLAIIQSRSSQVSTSFPLETPAMGGDSIPLFTSSAPEKSAIAEASALEVKRAYVADQIGRFLNRDDLTPQEKSLLWKYFANIDKLNSSQLTAAGRHLVEMSNKETKMIPGPSAGKGKIKGMIGTILKKFTPGSSRALAM